MKLDKSPSFFEMYASEYDAMTDAASREPKHLIEVRTLIDRFSPTSVLDAGCGTGLTASLFAQQGIGAMGIDVSPAMITLAREKEKDGPAPAQFKVTTFESLPREFDRKFDLIVCLGNSISGVSSEKKLAQSFRNFRRALMPGGWLVLQMLNPAVIKKGETFGVRVTRKGDLLYHRYATRPDERVFLHVIRTDLSTTPLSFQSFVHDYRLLTVAQFATHLKSAGFGRISHYPSLALEKSGRGVPSRDLVIAARRIS